MINICKKAAKLPDGVKASVAFFFASVVSSGISYIVTPIYTRILPADVFGQTSVFMTWVQVFGIVAMFCLSAGVFNNGMLDFPNKRDEYSFSMLILSNIITVVFFVVIMLLYPLIGEKLSIDFPLVILMCVLFFFQPAYNFWATRQRYEYKYRATVAWTIICAIASPLSAVLCVTFTDTNVLYARLFGAELVLVMVYIGFYVYLGNRSGWKIKTTYWRTALSFNLPLIPHYLSTYLLSNSNKLLISYIVNDTAVAYYSVAQSVAMVVTIVWSAINASLIPFTYEKCKKREYSKISAVTIPILTGFAVVCIMAIMFAPEVVSVMATSEYTEAIYVIPPIVGGVFFQVQYFIYANIVYYYKKPKYVMYASVSAIFINFALGYYFISTFGYLAAGYSTLICYILQAVLDYFAMRKVVKEKVYNMRYICILSATVVVASVMSNLLYDSTAARYTIVAVMFASCLVFGKRFLRIVKDMRNCED